MFTLVSLVSQFMCTISIHTCSTVQQWLHIFYFIGICFKWKNRSIRICWCMLLLPLSATLTCTYISKPCFFFYFFTQGFTAELGASGSFCPPHISLPVTASFFSLSDDRGSSPYLVFVYKFFENFAIMTQPQWCPEIHVQYL